MEAGQPRAEGMMHPAIAFGHVSQAFQKACGGVKAALAKVLKLSAHWFIGGRATPDLDGVDGTHRGVGRCDVRRQRTSAHDDEP